MRKLDRTFLLFQSTRATLAAGLLLGFALSAFSLGGCSEESKTQRFRWGADQEGGGPYIYPKEDDPTKAIGFEVDLAAEIGKRLGVKDEFVQTTWDQILPVLSRGDIDAALNGYEYMPDRATHYLASLPYYIYELSLCVRKTETALTGWDSLKQPAPQGRKWVVGVLEGSAADRYVSEKFSEHCEVKRYSGSTDSLRLLENKTLDASVQDVPIQHFYLHTMNFFPGLKDIDKPVAPGYYVIYARPEDSDLIQRINQAIRDIYQSGELRRIYERYGIWNDTQNGLPEVWSTWKSELGEDKENKWTKLMRWFPKLRNAAGVTILLAILSMPLAILIGLITALVRASNLPSLGGSGAAEPLLSRLLRAPFTLYVEIVRGTPLAFQLFVVYFVVPEVTGINIGEFWSGVIGLAINYSAYEAEIFRLGLQAIPKGQMEAALSLGMPRFLAIRRIILPQAIRLVIPATANDFIALFKDTAVCSVIAVEELSKQYSMGAKSTNLFLEMAALASILYLLMSYPLSLMAQWLERTLKRESQS